MTRDEIIVLQKQLLIAGYSVQVDGIYGPQTATAYQSFLDAVTPKSTSTPAPTAAKPWWQSRTVIGLLASVLAMLAGRFGWSVDDGQITEMLLRAVELGGLALAAWGTVRRSAPIDPTLVARVGTHDVRLPVRAERPTGATTQRDPRGSFTPD